MMKRIIFIFAAAAVLLYSCQRENNNAPAFGSDALSFSSDVIANDTKATMVENDAALQLSGFGVFAYYTGNNNFVNPADVSTIGTMLYNEAITYSSPDWTYNHIQYWPTNSGKVTFLAFAPFYSGGYTATVDATTKIPQVAYTAATSLSNPNDLLWGVNGAGLPFKDITEPSDKTVHFHFHHALAKVHLTISSDEDFSSINTALNNYSHSSGWGRPTYYYSDADTKIFIEDVTLTNLYSGATLSLLNTEANKPNWKNKTGTLNYDFTGYANLNSSLIYYTYQNGYLSNWSSTFGVTSASKDLLNGNYIMAIPKAMNEGDSVRVTVKYHVISRVHEYYYDWGDKYGNNIIVPRSNVTANDNDNNGNGTTVSATVKTNLEGGTEYNLHIALAGNYMKLYVKAKQWKEQVDSLNFSSSAIQIANVEDRIEWTPMTFDKLDDINGYVYVNAHTAECKFKISNPARYMWYASIIPIEGTPNAFEFVDENGNILKSPRGVIGEKAVLRIRSNVAAPTVRNVAILRIYAKTADGTHIIKEVGLHGTTEYQLIQNVS